MFVCLCFGVTHLDIQKILKASSSPSKEVVGVKCLAGTSCGACLAEIERLVREEKAAGRTRPDQEKCSVLPSL